MKSVLIIDDDKKIRDIIKIQLHKQDYRILEANGHAEAFRLLAAEDISVILCDIKIKESDGLMILKELKTSQYRQLPVIMLTGFINREISEQARAEGCFDFITKPVKRQKLIDSIHRALDESNQ